MSDSTGGTGAGTTGKVPGTGGGWARILPAATFLIGLALGGVLVAVGTSGGVDDGEPEAQATPTETADPSLSPGDTVVTVPAACEESAEMLRDAIGLLRGSLDSVRDFDPDRLVEILNELEEIDTETRPLLDECAVDVSEAPSPSPTESPDEPTDEPTD